jgi:hypothetical protein
LDRSDDMIATALQNIILNTIRVPETYQRYDEINEAHVRTFDWLLHDKAPDEMEILSASDFDGQLSDQSDSSSASDDDEEDDIKRIEARDILKRWLLEESGIFHLCGKPGSGKSVLMKYLSSHPEMLRLLKIWAGNSPLSVGTFFLWKPGASSQKKLPGLIRGLLHSLLSDSQDLIPIAFPELSKSPAVFIRTQNPIDDRSVRKAFNNILDWLAAGSSHRTALLIDGLDELDGDLPDLVRTLFQWVDRCRGSLKILVSSREWNIFEKSFSNCPRIRLHEVTMKDMEIFISGRLDSNDEFLEFDSDARLEIKSTIATKAEGVFLWVALVLRVTEEALLAGDSPSELSAKLAECPPELGKLFSRILESIQISDRTWAFRAIKMVRFNLPVELFHEHSMPLMTLLMWTFLGDYNNDASFALKLRPRACGSEDIQNHINLAKRMIYGRCKGFLEVVSTSHKCVHGRYEAKVIHSSIWEFLQRQEIQAVMRPHVVGFDVLDCALQTFLAMFKIRRPDDCYQSCSDHDKPIRHWKHLVRKSLPWNYIVPDCLGDYLLNFLLLHTKALGSNRSSRTWQALDAIGPAMGQVKHARYPRDASQCEQHELGLYLSLATCYYEYLEWRADKSYVTLTPLPHQFYRTALSGYKKMLRHRPSNLTYDEETRIIKMNTQLSVLKYDWNKPVYDIRDSQRQIVHQVIFRDPVEGRIRDTLTDSLDDYSKKYGEINGRALSTWESIVEMMIESLNPRLLDSMIRQGVNTECVVLQDVSKDFPHYFGEEQVCFALYHKGTLEDVLAGVVPHLLLAPVSSPICYLAWKCNGVIRFWDLVRFQIPELFEYYVQLATSPRMSPPEMLTTVRPLNCIGYDLEVQVLNRSENPKLQLIIEVYKIGSLG